MQTLQYCVQARNKLTDIKTKQMPKRAKILLLESLKQKLKQAHQFQSAQSPLKSKQLDLSLSTTFFTQTKSLINREEQQTLIDQILKKQRQKIEIDEEIETSQDDLNQIMKTVETKKEYSEELSKRIWQRSRQIEKETAKLRDKQKEEKEKEKEKEHKLSKVKSTPSLFKKIFG